MARQDARKQFVQARLKALGGDATPEQKAKLRQRFNKLSETKEGRTRIAQVVLPSGTAEQRKALKQSIRPVKSTGTNTGTTGGGSKVDLTGVRDAKPYRPTVISDGNTVKNNFQSSAVIPSNKSNFRINVGPATELPLGVGGVVKGVKMVQGGNYLGGVGRTLLGVAEVGVSIASAVRGRLGKQTKIDANLGSTSVNKTNPFANQKVTQFDPSNLRKALDFYKTTPANISKPTTPFVGLKSTQFDPSNLRKALESYTGAATTPSKITGANKPTSMPTVPNFAPKSTVPEPKVTPAPVKSSKTKKSTATTVPTATTIPTATTVPKAPTTTVLKKTTVTTIPTSVSPPSTAPRQYDAKGKGIGEPLDIRVGDPMPVKPRKPAGVSKSEWEMSDAVIDYEVRLQNYYRYNKITPPKKK